MPEFQTPSSCLCICWRECYFAMPPERSYRCNYTLWAILKFMMWLDLKLFWVCVNQMGSYCTRLITSFELTTSSLLSATGSLEGIEIWELDRDYRLYLLKFEGVMLLPSTSTWCWLDSILSSSSMTCERETSLLLWGESEWASDSFSPPSSRD